MALETVDTVAEIFAALGGNPGVEAITGSKPSTLSMWKSAGAFPSNTYVVLTAALRACGKTAPASLWGMKLPVEAAE